MKPFLILAVLAVCAAAPSRAGESGACKADFEKLCPGVEPGEGRVMKCLKEHEAELSEGCRAMKGGAKDKMKEKAQELEEACKADREKVCKGVEPGEGRIKKCMSEHEAELSEKCRGMMAAYKEKHEKMKGMKDKAEACLADKERFCKDFKPGEGRIVECLKAHEAELSEGCRAAKLQKHEKHEKHEKKEKAPETKK